ncbi:hypothetical protein ACWGB8_13325 [Kitasatospora sp. NPDC054939]
MLPRTVRGVVAVAAELVEEVGKRVVGTAAGLLERGGVDLAEVERKLGGPFPPSAKQLQTLAEEAVTAGRAGVDLAVGVARSEVEKAFEKVGDQVTKVGVVLSFLESKLREVEEEPVPVADGPAPRADGLFGHGWDGAPAEPGPVAAERVVVDEPVERPVNGAAGGAAPRTAEEAPTAGEAPAAGDAGGAAGGGGSAPAGTAGKAAAVGKAPAAGKAAAKKAAAKKAAAEKTVAAEKPAGGTTAAKPGAKKAAAKKTTTKTAVAKKTAEKKAAAKKTAAEPEAPAKRTATRKTTVRRASTAKKSDDA